MAELLGTASTAMVITARGAEQHASGTATAQAFINLALALGLPGRPGSGYGTLTGQGNGQGGREHGQKADQLPGYRKITDLAHRAHVAGVWGVDPTRLPGPGVSATEMLRALGTPGGVRTLLLLASNVTVSAPDAGSVTDRVDALDFLMVADLFLSESAARADVVLPVAMWAEEEGTMTNLEGRVLRRRRALDPPPGVRTDLDVLAGVADRLGLGHLMTTDAAAAFEELGRASAGGVADYGGITYDRIEDEQGVFWPCTDADDPGTPRLFADRFAHPDGLARFTRAEFREPAERTDPEFPYVLTTGRRDAAVPERHADPAGRGARGRRGGSRRDGPAARRAAPRPGPPLRCRRRRAGAAAHPPGRRGVPGAADHRHPDRHGVRPVPLGGRVPREHPHARRPRPGLPHARVQGVRRRRRPRSPHAARHRPAPPRSAPARRGCRPDRRDSPWTVTRPSCRASTR